jgi:hypothetical protein
MEFHPPLWITVFVAVVLEAVAVETAFAFYDGMEAW